MKNKHLFVYSLGLALLQGCRGVLNNMDNNQEKAQVAALRESANKGGSQQQSLRVIGGELSQLRDGGYPVLLDKDSTECPHVQLIKKMTPEYIRTDFPNWYCVINQEIFDALSNIQEGNWDFHGTRDILGILCDRQLKYSTCGDQKDVTYFTTPGNIDEAQRYAQNGMILAKCLRNVPSKLYSWEILSKAPIPYYIMVSNNVLETPSCSEKYNQRLKAIVENKDHLENETVVENMRLKLAGGVDYQWKDQQGNTLLACAVAKGNLGIVDALLGYIEAGDLLRQDKNPVLKLALDIPNNDGNTPLIIAVQNGHLEMVEALLDEEKKPDFHLKNHKGETALSLAQRGEHGDIVQLLGQYA